VVYVTKSSALNIARRSSRSGDIDSLLRTGTLIVSRKVNFQISKAVLTKAHRENEILRIEHYYLLVNSNYGLLHMSDNTAFWFNEEQDWCFPNCLVDLLFFEVLSMS
jgi:hypothetical protein